MSTTDQGDLALVVEVGHPFIHRAPRHLTATCSGAQAPDSKLSGIVNHGLNPQDQAEFVVHIQPVVLHAVFDPGTGPAIFLTLSEYFPLESRMKPSAQERQDVLSRKLHRAVVQQPRVETSQHLTTGEDHIGGELGLGRRPNNNCSHGATTVSSKDSPGAPDD